MGLFRKSTLRSLRKSKTLLIHTVNLYKKKKHKLQSSDQEKLKSLLEQLQTALIEKKQEAASAAAIKLEHEAAILLKKTSLEKLRDLIFALLFTLAAAVLIRQEWFELYEIPSGSMRPTFKEQDRLVVSKTDLGINLPLMLGHAYFDPNLVERNNIVVFSGQDMDIHDVDTLYFYLFPGKKQYVKRLIGKPGDILYFYGGRIYGIDAQGNDISNKLQPEALSLIEHIPFIDFLRKIQMSPAQKERSSILVYQMNEPIAKLSLLPQQRLSGEMLPLHAIHDKTAPQVESYSDLWGMGNFGMTRLLTKEEVTFLLGEDLDTLQTTLGSAPLYLEIRHNPSLKSAHLFQDTSGRLFPELGIERSLIPLQEHHLQALFQALYTARFVVKQDCAYRYGSSPDLSGQTIFLPHLPEVPSGTYEFDQGIPYRVGFGGITYSLPSTHPLTQFSIPKVQLLYNIGMEWDMRYAPQQKERRLYPSRYAYYRNGDLYLMGQPILKRDDPTLCHFVEREITLGLASSPSQPYVPFIDRGPPLHADGSLNIPFIRQYGLQVPEKGYLVLGDNHANSGDSREFGFVPAENLRGAPSFIFWPPGKRWGPPNQAGYPWLTLPCIVIWFLALITIGGSTLYYRKKHRLPMQF